MFLITGYPRSGTTFTRKLLRRHGVKVGGERYGRRKDLVDEEPVEGVVSWMHINLYRASFPVVLHQTRHPIQVIGSAQTLYNNTFRRLFTNTGAPKLWNLKLCLGNILPLGKATVVEWAMYTWLHWNELIENDPRVVYRYRIEDIESEWKAILRRINIPEGTMPELSKDVNTRRSDYDGIDVAKLQRYNSDLADKIIRKGRKYGYGIEDSSGR